MRADDPRALVAEARLCALTLDGGRPFIASLMTRLADTLEAATRVIVPFAVPITESDLIEWQQLALDQKRSKLIGYEWAEKTRPLLNVVLRLIGAVRTQRADLLAARAEAAALRGQVTALIFERHLFATHLVRYHPKDECEIPQDAKATLAPPEERP